MRQGATNCDNCHVGACQVAGAAAVNETDEEIAEDDDVNETEEERTEQGVKNQRRGIVRQLM